MEKKKKNGGERDVGKAWKVGDVPYGEVELERERESKKWLTITIVRDDDEEEEWGSVVCFWLSLQQNE